MLELAKYFGHIWILVLKTQIYIFDKMNVQRNVETDTEKGPELIILLIGIHQFKKSVRWK